MIFELALIPKPSSYVHDRQLHPLDVCYQPAQTGSNANLHTPRECSPHLDDHKCTGASLACILWFSGGLGNVQYYLVPCSSCQLSHHTLCFQDVALSASRNMLSSNGFKILVVTSRSWLLDELCDACVREINCLDFFLLFTGWQSIDTALWSHRIWFPHLTSNAITDNCLYGCWGTGTFDLSDFEMRKLHISFD